MVKKSHNSSSRRHGSFSKTWQNIGLLVLIAAVVVAGAFALRPTEVSPEVIAADKAANSAVAADRETKAQASAKALAERTNVAFLGDSYTAGQGASKQSNRWSSVLTKSESWDELNFGFGGTNYGTPGSGEGGTTYVQRVPNIIAAAPDVVIVSGGGNDLGSNQSEGISDTFQKLRAGLPDAKIIALSPFWKASALPPELKTVSKQIKAAVKSVDGQYLELKNPLEGKPSLLDDDGVHPNDEGHALIAESVKSQL